MAPPVPPISIATAASDNGAAWRSPVSSAHANRPASGRAANCRPTTAAPASARTANRRPTTAAAAPSQLAEHIGRVRVRYPWLDDKYVSGWARTVQFGAGKDRGAFVLPEVGDEVLVELTPYDLTKGRITYRFMPGRPGPPGYNP